MSELPTEYTPGACNIGGRERTRRYRLAGLCFAVATVYLGAVVGLRSVPAVLAVGLFVPFSLGVELFLQARRSFCASLGFGGRYDFRETDGVGEAGRAPDADAVAADRRYAFELTLLGVLGGAVLTAVVTAGVLWLG